MSSKAKLKVTYQLKRLQNNFSHIIFRKVFAGPPAALDILSYGMSVTSKNFIKRRHQLNDVNIWDLRFNDFFHPYICHKRHSKKQNNDF